MKLVISFQYYNSAGSLVRFKKGTDRYSQFFQPEFNLLNTMKAGVLKKGHRLILVIAAVRLPTGSQICHFGSLCAALKNGAKKRGR